MTKLKEALTEAEAPGIGEVDATEPATYGKVVVGSAIVLGGISVASYAVSQLQGTGIVQSTQNQFDNIESQFAGGL